MKKNQRVLIAFCATFCLVSLTLRWQFRSSQLQMSQDLSPAVQHIKTPALAVDRSKTRFSGNGAPISSSLHSNDGGFSQNRRDFLMSERKGSGSIWKRQCERPVTKVVYLKTHKTGSTALFSLILNYLSRHGVRSNAIARICGHPVAGYPGRFRCEFKVPSDATASVYHARFDFDEMSKCFAPETRYVSIVRHPWANFQSALSYYGKKFVDDVQCHGMPISYLSNGKQLDVNEFLLKCDKLLNSSVPWYFRFNNCQAHDLGMDPTLTNEDEIQRQIQEIDDNMHLVLINEYMDESLVLLKNVLCMDWNDIKMRVKVPRHSSSHQFASEKHRNIFTKLNNIDLALYDHFNRTLWRKVDEYGREKFAQDLEKVRNLRRRVRRDAEKKKKKRKKRSTCSNEAKSAEWWASLKRYTFDNAGGCYMP